MSSIFRRSVRGLSAAALCAVVATGPAAYADTGTQSDGASGGIPIIDTTSLGGPATTGLVPDTGTASVVIDVDPATAVPPATTHTGKSPQTCTTGGASHWTTMTKKSTFMPISLGTSIAGPATIHGSVNAGTSLSASITGGVKSEISGLIVKAEANFSLTLSATVSTGMSYSVDKPVPANTVGHLQLGIGGEKITFNSYQLAYPCRAVLVSSKTVTAPITDSEFAWNYWQTKP